MPADIYLKMTDVEGESTATNHEGETEILSLSHGVSMAVGNRSNAGSPTSDKASQSDVSVTKYTDKATAALFAGTCAGKVFKEAVISVNRTDGQGGQVEYLKITLTDAIISGFSQSAGAGGGLPIESVSLNYATITIDYTATDPSSAGAAGSMTGGWDFATNQPV